MSLCLIKHHAIKANRKVKVQLHALTSALGGDDGQFHALSVLFPRNESWYPGSRAGLDVLKNRKLLLQLGIEHKFLIRLNAGTCIPVTPIWPLTNVLFWESPLSPQVINMN